MKEASVSRVRWNRGAGSDALRLGEVPMLYVGLDIHTKHIALCVRGETGQVVQGARVRGLEEVLRLLRRLPDRFDVCYEASCGHYPSGCTPGSGMAQRDAAGVNGSSR